MIRHLKEEEHLRERNIGMIEVVDIDHHRDGQYDNTNRYDRRRWYDKRNEAHEDGLDMYTGRTNTERNHDRRDRDYYYGNDRRYEDRYDEYSCQDNRYFEHKDSSYSYRRDYDTVFYRH